MFKFKKIMFLISIILVVLTFFSGCDMFSDGSKDATTPQYGELPEQSTTVATKSDSKAKISFLDVGQADCILLEFSGKTMLIDGGNREDGKNVVNYIKKSGYDYIDFMVETHSHEDHIGGLPTVLSEISVGQVFMPSKAARTTIYKEFISSIDKNGAKKIIPEENRVIYNDSKACVTVISKDNKTDGVDLNDTSIVIKFEYGKNSFIFTGDAGTSVEKDIMSRYSKDFLDVDVLKVGHHGSKTSSSVEWLKTLSPKYAVIMCEKGNKYGHPHKQTLNNLSKLKIETLRTDLSGTIVMTTDGSQISVKKSK